jgi:transposase-like protein
MTTTRRFPPEVRERAVRLVFDQEQHHSSQWSCIEAIAPKIGCTPQTLRAWVKQAEIDQGRVDGVTSNDRQRMKEMERELKELRRANEILRKASAYFAQAELDRRPK